MGHMISLIQYFNCAYQYLLKCTYILCSGDAAAATQIEQIFNSSTDFLGYGKSMDLEGVHLNPIL